MMDAYVIRTPRVPVDRIREAAVKETKQIKLTQLKKVTLLEDIQQYASQLKQAQANEDWQRVEDILLLLQPVHMTRQLLETSGIGLIVNEIKKLNKSNKTNQSNESNHLNPSECDSSLQTRIASLSAQLVSTWKLSVQKQTAAELNLANEQKRFGAYSLDKYRIKCYRTFYFRLCGIEVQIEQKKERRMDRNNQLNYATNERAAILARTLETCLYNLCQQQVNATYTSGARLIAVELKQFSSIEQVVNQLYSNAEERQKWCDTLVERQLNQINTSSKI